MQQSRTWTELVTWNGIGWHVSQQFVTSCDVWLTAWKWSHTKKGATEKLQGLVRCIANTDSRVWFGFKPKSQRRIAGILTLCVCVCVWRFFRDLCFIKDLFSGLFAFMFGSGVSVKASWMQFLLLLLFGISRGNIFHLLIVCQWIFFRIMVEWFGCIGFFLSLSLHRFTSFYRQLFFFSLVSILFLLWWYIQRWRHLFVDIAFRELSSWWT